MKKWITGTVLACTIVSTATLQAAAKPAFSNKICDWLQSYGITLPLCGTEKPSVPKPEQKPIVPETQKPTVQDSTYAKQVLDLVNAERTKHGLGKLTLDTKLNVVALAHSEDMAKNKYFSHTNLKGQSPFDRIKAAGVSYRNAAENIAVGQKSPEQVVKSWMNSEGHRKNILNGAFKKMGLGYVKAQGGYGTYWTQVFTD
ncbi:MAG: CAP domain-containing protein [Clostridia bacterium]|nr:CAP domain-containing protein [Clostridia bacterium]